MDEKIRILWDHHEINDLLQRYSRGFDRCDMEEAKGTHWPDAQVDYPNFIGPAHGMCDSADAIHKAQFDSTPHYVTNNRIDLDGDTAHTETYFIMAGRLKDTTTCLQLGGRYVRRLERRGGEWRIASCVCLLEWSSSGDALAAVLATGAKGARDKSDPIYTRPLDVEREPSNVALSLG